MRTKRPVRDPFTLPSTAYLTAEEASIFLPLPLKSVYRLPAKGIGKCVPGVGIRFLKRQLERYLAGELHGHMTRPARKSPGEGAESECPE